MAIKLDRNKGSVPTYFLPINEEDIDIDCHECGLNLGYVEIKDLKITKEPMFICPCGAKFDFIKTK